jgi:hypothetical protein
MNYEVIPASQIHVGPHVAHLSAEIRQAIQEAKGPPRRFIRWMIGQSSYARAGLIDGFPVALWGITGTMMASTGFAWLSVTEELRRHPFLAARVAREEAFVNLRSKELHSLVLDGDIRAERFLRFLGFEIGEISASECGKTFRAAVLRRTWTL